MQDLVARAQNNLQRYAVIEAERKYTYHELLQASADFAARLLDGERDLQERRVAFMVTPGFDYVMVQWAAWRAGGIAVPLCVSYPLASLAYVIEDTESDFIVVSSEYERALKDFARQKGIRFIVLGEEKSSIAKELPILSPERRAMILYTSGTTSQPKGVVTTHHQLHAQITSLVEAWEWSSGDAILNVLPLHHVHGIVNVTCCALYSGASCRFLPSFDPEAVFRIFLEGEVNLFMAVPTIYYKLISYFESLSSDAQREISKTMEKFRLMVSGSAALPVSTMERWEKISGHTLLERYGMTEIGMAISNPYKGVRRPGCVGFPLPGVSIRLVGEDFCDVEAETPGEVLVKGDNVFSEYWKRPEATQEAFTSDGWFKTGDVAVVDHGYYRIMGRNSVDIIKSGGYKISALEVEEVLRTHPMVRDCAVVGIENEEWGEIVAAAIVVGESQTIDFISLNAWMREKMPAYRVPRNYKAVADFPRNAMGKVVKNELKKLF